MVDGDGNRAIVGSEFWILLTQNAPEISNRRGRRKLGNDLRGKDFAQAAEAKDAEVHERKISVSAETGGTREMIHLRSTPNVRAAKMQNRLTAY